MFTRRSVLTSLIALGLIGAGCQSASHDTTTSAMAAPTKAVIVTTGNGTTVLYLPTESGDTKMMSTAGASSCKQCQADVAAYFKTGELTKVCSTCGATRVPVQGHN